MKDTGTHHHGPLAGVSAGAAAVLFAFGVLALAWHRVAGQVSMGVTVLVYAVIAAVAVTFGAWTWYVVLWVRHRARNPELLAGRRAAPAAEPAAPAIGATAEPLAIEPPRVYLTDDQFAALVRRHDAEE